MRVLLSPMQSAHSHVPVVGHQYSSGNVNGLGLRSNLMETDASECEGEKNKTLIFGAVNVEMAEMLGR